MEKREREESVPGELVEFLGANGIPAEVLDILHSLPRFIRVHGPPLGLQEVLQGYPQAQPTALEGFYRLPGEVGLAQSALYKQGRVDGMDLSSGYAVAALDPRPGDLVLDVCCAPGTKLMMIADRMRGQGLVIGVDIALPRLQTTRNRLIKYGVKNAELILADSVNLPFRKGVQFDRVLVDAECTHDGSLRHLKRLKDRGWESFRKRVSDPAKLASIQNVQKQLLLRGFEVLKQSGSLIYSTCSMAKLQNEDVVQSLLDERKDANSVPASAIDVPKSLAEEGYLPNTLRFNPLKTETSFLFIAPFEKSKPS